MPGKGFSFGDMFRAIREMGLENTLDRWYGIYPAEVVDNADPSQQGKVKARLPFLGFPDSHPRFSYPVSPYAGRNHGFYFPPHEDESAWITFDQGDTNSARVVGGWWGNEGKQDPKQPETSFVPPEFCRSDGSNPTGRGIKTREGHFIAFDGDEENYYVELTSASNPTETVDTTDAQGNTTSRVVTSVGSRAEKHHRIRLDDTAEQAVFATFGVANSNAETILDNDLNAEVDRKELSSRLRHWLLMRDKSTDRFVQLKSVGDTETEFHQLLLSDTDKIIRIDSTDRHSFSIDDANQISTWEMANGYRIKIDQANQAITGETDGGRSFTLDDARSVASVVTPNHDLTFSDSDGTTLNDSTGQPMQVTTAGDLDVTAEGDHTMAVAGSSTITVAGDESVTISGDETVLVSGDMTLSVTGTLQKVIAILDIVATGTISMSGTQITIQAPRVQIGQGAIQRLCNETFLALFNSHTHQNPGPGNILSAAASGFLAVPGTHTTLATSAG